MGLPRRAARGQAFPGQALNLTPAELALIERAQNAPTRLIRGQLRGLALTLLTVVVYLRQRKANYWPYLIPMAFMMVVTVVAMVINLEKYWMSGNVLLTFVADCIGNPPMNILKGTAAFKDGVEKLSDLREFLGELGRVECGGQPAGGVG